MAATKETIDNIVDEYFKQPSKSLTSIIFNEYAKDLTIEESKKVYEIVKEKLEGKED